MDKNHPALIGKVVSEACYSTTNATYSSTSLCPDGDTQSTATDSALPYINNCPTGECDHGTHVAGIVAANNTTIKGVAKDSNLLAIQVFSRIDSSYYCGSEPTPCVLSFTSDQIKGLERVYALRTSFSIASANLSLGGEAYSNTCDTIGVNISYKAAVDMLRSAGIVTVAASGNNGYTNAIASPACISSVVSVGASTDYDAVASFSNSAEILDLLAPGNLIYSSIPLSPYYANYNGTSMAAPHVAGAWALIKSAKADATVNEILQVFKDTGVPIQDTRNSLIKPRIDVLAAFQQIMTPPAAIPLNVFASNGTYTDKVEISWDAAAHATYYQIYRNLNDSINGASKIQDNQITIPYSDTTAIPGTIYYYWIKGCNLIGCSVYSLSDLGWIGTTELTPPTGVQASDGLFNDKIIISWNGVGGADYYQVFRNEITDSNTSTKIADTIIIWSFEDSSAEVGKEYYYWVKACKTQGQVCSTFSAYDSGSLKEDYGIYLPLINKNYADVDPIKNGDFELGRDGSWTESSSTGFDLILPQESLLVLPHSGSWAVWLGGEDYETSRLSQSVLISSSRPYLHYWYWIGSEDICGYDFYRLKVNSSVLIQTDLCDSTSTNGWVERVVNLSSYSGSTATIMFEVTLDGVLNSNFFLDDVSMSSNSITSAVISG